MRSARISDASLAVAYVRVSTSEQHLGPDAQRAAIEAWARQVGVRVVAWHEDRGVGGSTDIENRPGLTRALHDLREHRAGVLVVAKRDRVARDVALAIAIERAVARQGARIVSADGTANGDDASDELMRIVLSGMAAYERALIRSRTRAALQAKRAKGFRAGEVPFGFTADAEGRLHPCPAEQQVLVEVSRLRDEGLSLRAIVQACAARGLRSRAGTVFGLTQIARMLKASRLPCPATEGAEGRAAG